MRFCLFVLAVSGALLLAAFLVAAESHTAAALQGAVTVTMGPATGPAGGGSQTGTITLTAVGNQTELSVNIQPGEAGVTQPIHIHSGTCDNLPGSLGAIVHDLTNGGVTGVVNGSFTTIVDASPETLQTGDFAINVHKSGPEIGVYVSCGNIPASAGSVPSTEGPPPSSGDDGLAWWYVLIGAGALVLLGGGAVALRLRRQQ